MKTPKMLPWIARSAGLTDARGVQLWLEASEYASNAAGETDTPKFWKAAHERFVDLVQAEAMVSNPPETTPWVMIQTNLGRFLLLVTEFFAEVSANLRTWFTRSIHHRAA